SWFQSAGAEEHARELRSKGQASMAWHGKLEYPHPHQRHIFDLPTLRTETEHNVALDRLYLWATGGDSALEEGHIAYRSFIKPCAEFLARVTSFPGGSSLSIDRSIAARLSERVVDFFRDYYTRRFADINLFELLDKAAPPSYSDSSRDEQISGYFLEHLEYLYGLMSSLIAFEAELWPEGLSTL